MRVTYKEELDSSLGIWMLVDFQTIRRVLVYYSVVLLRASASNPETIRVYDCAHGFNEMHRYTRADGKQDGVVFSRATVGEGMRVAVKDVKGRYLAMIEGWEK